MTDLSRAGLRVALVFALSATAFAKPNFSGTWKLDTAKSDFGSMPGPTSMTRVIKHAEPALDVKTTQVGQRGEFTTELKYTTDGSESVNKTQMGDVKGVANWDGDILVVKYKIQTQQAGEIEIEDRWEISADSKTTTVKSTIKGGFGEAERRMVFAKE